MSTERERERESTRQESCHDEWQAGWSANDRTENDAYASARVGNVGMGGGSEVRLDVCNTEAVQWTAKGNAGPTIKQAEEVGTRNERNKRANQEIESNPR